MDSRRNEKQPIRERLFRAIVRARVPIVVVFALLAAVGLALRPLVGVNYNMSDYLPASAPSTVALHTMEETYEGDIPSVRVMVENVGLPEAREMKDRLAAVEGVTDVTWLDDVASLEVPLAMQDADVVDAYYRAGRALYSVSIDAAQRLSAVEGIREAAGDGAALTGESVSTETATKSTVGEIAIISVCGVAFAVLVLALTTTSWLMPLVILLGLGVAVAINTGSNLMFGTISFVSNAAGAILQIAIALDFSVFLVHRYEECRGRCGSAEEDMVMALCKSSTAILASGCAVMIGFLALTVMQFQIGVDLGLVLAKGILVSLITVFTFLPGFILICLPLIDRTAHRPLLRGTGALGRGVVRVCVPLACGFVLLAAPAYLASTSDDITYWYGAANIFGDDTAYGRDTARIEEAFGQSDTLAVMVAAGDVAREEELSRALNAQPFVTNVVSYVDAASPAIPRAMAGDAVLSQLDGGGWTRMVVTVDVPAEGAATHEAVAAIRALAEEYYPGQWLVAGGIASTADLKLTITEDKDLVDVIAIVAVLIVLVFATRSLSLPFILVFVIETAIWCNFALPSLAGTPVFYLSYLIVSTIQLGVTVDYAILFSDRYCECRRTMPKRDAVVETVRVTTLPILTSGTVLTVVGFVLGAVSSHGVLSQLGHFLGVGVAMSLVAVIFVLPGYLYLFDGVVSRTTLKAHFLNAGKGTKHENAA